MQLYFLRHGIADWPNWDPTRDHERPLTKEGIKKMKATAKMLKALDLKFDAILASPYTRAWQTADIVANVLKLDVQAEPNLAPGFDLDKAAQILRKHAAAKALLLVGHEPTLSRVIAQLIDGGHVVMKKGALARVDIPDPDEAHGELVWLLPPKILTV